MTTMTFWTTSISLSFCGTHLSMTLTRWRSTILSATRSRPPRLGGSSRNAASSSSFLSFTRSRFLSSEVTTTFGRARIHREAIGFFVDCLHLFGGRREPPTSLSFLRLSFPECRGEKVKISSKKVKVKTPRPRLGLFFFCLACVLSYRNFAFFSYPKISSLFIFLGETSDDDDH